MNVSVTRLLALLTIAATAPFSAHAQGRAEGIPALAEYLTQLVPAPQSPPASAAPAAAALFDAGSRLDVASLPGTRVPRIDQNLVSKEILLVNQEPGAVVTVGAGPHEFGTGGFFAYFRTKEGRIPPTAQIGMTSAGRFNPNHFMYARREPLTEEDGELRLNDYGGNSRVEGRLTFRRYGELLVIKLEERKVRGSTWATRAYMIADLNRHQGPLP